MDQLETIMLLKYGTKEEALHKWCRQLLASESFPISELKILLKWLELDPTLCWDRATPQIEFEIKILEARAAKNGPT